MVVVMGHVKNFRLSFSDINKSCVLIIMGSRILREKAFAQPYSREGSRRLSGSHV